MIQLVHGDCREILPTIGEVDTVITDPVWPNVPPNLLNGWEDPFTLLRDALDLIQARRVVIVTRGDSDPRFLSAVPARWKFFRLQNLPYAVPARIGRKLIGDEIAYCFGEPVPSRPGRRVIPGYGPRVQPHKILGHPCPRSVGHFKWLVNWWTEPGELVLDPFMGSGTTALACYELGRDFIGVEIDPGYYQIAQSRLAEAQTHPTLWGGK